MVEVILCLILHCVMSFILKYCYDKEIIWHNNENAPHLRMPKLSDLDESSSTYDKQEYMEKVIFTSRDYFSAICEIEKEQKNEPLLQMVSWAPTFLLVANAFRRAFITQYHWLNVLLGIGVSVLIIFIVSFIYNQTALKLKTFSISVSDMKKRFELAKNERDRDFVLSEENALNNFLIEMHHNYIDCVKYTIDKRYRVKKIVESVTGLIYVLFIMRIPN